MPKAEEKDLHHLGERILATIASLEETHAEMQKKLDQLKRIASFYLRGIDPRDIKGMTLPPDGMATITMVDGTMHRMPVGEISLHDHKLYFEETKRWTRRKQ